MRKTNIPYADVVWEVTAGCSRAGAGCDNCWARRLAEGRMRHIYEAQGADFDGNVQVLEDRLSEPLRCKAPKTIFVNSRSDLFHPSVPFEFVDRVFAVIALCPQHSFLLLTKRSKRAAEYSMSKDLAGRICTAAFALNSNSHTRRCDEPIRFGKHLKEAIRYRASLPLPNAWLGVSIWDQASAEAMIPQLLAMPAAHRWVSAEPLLGDIRLDRLRVRGNYLNAFTLDYYDDAGNVLAGPPSGYGSPDLMVAGGESGPGARPCHPDWARGLRDQCQAAGVPFCWKQWGSNQPISTIDGRQEQPFGNVYDVNTGYGFVRKRDTGFRLLDGVEHWDLPWELHR